MRNSTTALLWLVVAATSAANSQSIASNSSMGDFAYSNISQLISPTPSTEQPLESTLDEESNTVRRLTNKRQEIANAQLSPQIAQHTTTLFAGFSGAIIFVASVLIRKSDPQKGN